MKTLIVICAVSIQLTTVGQSLQTSPKNDSEWRVGTYIGLTPGKSKRADVLRVLGKPKRLDTPEGQDANEPNPEIWYVYETGGEFPGDLTVVLDKRSNTVLQIDLNPVSLSKEDALKHFGPDYIETRYDFDDCLGTDTSAPLYESAKGQVFVIEYRHRGIAVFVNYEGKVTNISYVSKPVGARKSKCNKTTSEVSPL